MRDVRSSWVRSAAVLLVAGVTVLSVSACSGMRKVGNAALPGQPFGKTPKVVCKQSNKDYVGAKEMPPLKAPPGLEAPNTRNALRVPTLNTPERVRGPEEPCLDAPPAFSTTKAEPAPQAPSAPPRQPREVPTD